MRLTCKKEFRGLGLKPNDQVDATIQDGEYLIDGAVLISKATLDEHFSISCDANGSEDSSVQQNQTGMQMFIGTKTIMARPQQNGDKEGYEVVYEDGYRSWSPKETFEKAYRLDENLTFGDAVHLMKSGHKMSRAGWNGKSMFVFLVQGSTFKVNRPPLNQFYCEGTEVTYQPHIDMKTVDGTIVPWLASQTDILAEDWGVVL